MTEHHQYALEEIDALVHQSIEKSDIGYVVLDRACCILVWNQWMERTSGHTANQVLGRTFGDVFPETRDSRLEDALTNAVEHGMAGILSARLHRAPPIRLHRIGGETEKSPLTNPVVIIRPLPGLGRDSSGCLVQVLDETSSALREKTLRNQAIALKAQEEQLRALFEAINDSVIVLDGDGMIASLNDTACLRLRGQKSALLHARYTDLLPPANLDITQRHLSALAQSGVPQRFEMSRDHETFLVSLFPIFDRNEKIERIAVMECDITERKQFEERIYHLAHHDPLTGLPNRAYLMDRLSHAINIARRADRNLALMFLDLDQFKAVNDTMGHEQGDALLKFVAGKLRALVRGTDTVARMGGDEFVILLEQVASEIEVSRIAEKVTQSLSIHWGDGDSKIRVSASVGISVFPGNGDEARLLMKAADMAMYAAKSEGKNTFRFFSEQMNIKTLKRIHLEQDLRDAVARNELEVYYQPKICLVCRQPSGAEALVRWIHRERGAVSPSEFIPVAEETGAIVAIGDWVVDRVCRQIADWRAAGRGIMPIAVNVSAKQLFSRTFVDHIVASVKYHNIPYNCFQIEITESAVMGDPVMAARILLELRAMGIFIAIDDFGTGYSSLAYLSRLPVDLIKIDRSFVAGLADNKENIEIINAIVALGRSLNMGVVAEGVETVSDVRVLTQASCLLGQGYLFARPMRASDLETWMTRHHHQQGREHCNCPLVPHPVGIDAGI